MHETTTKYQNIQAVCAVQTSGLRGGGGGVSRLTVLKMKYTEEKMHEHYYTLL